MTPLVLSKISNSCNCLLSPWHVSMLTLELYTYPITFRLATSTSESGFYMQYTPDELSFSPLGAPHSINPISTVIPLQLSSESHTSLLSLFTLNPHWSPYSKSSQSVNVSFTSLMSSVNQSTYSLSTGRKVKPSLASLKLTPVSHPQSNLRSTWLNTTPP
jgi:hypothetical protein